MNNTYIFTGAAVVAALFIAYASKTLVEPTLDYETRLIRCVTESDDMKKCQRIVNAWIERDGEEAVQQAMLKRSQKMMSKMLDGSTF